MRESFTTADGRALTYRREGSGPVLVCHPGGPGYSSRYFGDLAGLGELFTLVLLDPRGTGGSDRPSDALAYGLDDYVGDVEELGGAHLGLEQLLLLGHSHGGVLAAQAYAAAPTRGASRSSCSRARSPRFQEEHVDAMAEASCEKRKEQPWFEEAVQVLEAEQAGQTGRPMPSSATSRCANCPSISPATERPKRPYLDTLKDELPERHALRLFNKEIVGALRPAAGARQDRRAHRS